MARGRGPAGSRQREHPQGDERGGVSELRQPEPRLASPCGSAPERGSAPGDDPTGCVWVPARTGGDPRGARSGADGGAGGGETGGTRGGVLGSNQGEAGLRAGEEGAAEVENG